jgi:Tetratricopeptide repeat
MAWLDLVATIALAATQGAVRAEPPNADHLFAVTGYIGDWDEDDGDWFQLIGVDMRLHVPSGEEREVHWRLIAASVERGVALRLRFNGSAGRLTADGTYLLYPLCSIGAANGASFGDEVRNCPPSPQAPTAERLLALGFAQTFDHPERARTILAQALEARPGLPPSARALALEARGEAAESLSYHLDPTEARHDRLLSEALADYRAQAALRPGDAAAQFAVARMLLTLGAYAEALELYRRIGRQWPNEDFEVAVRIGALHRQQGNYDGALRALDDYARAAGSSTFGMKFHYHRAWTLTLLGRDREALGEIERGLESQPDYSSAYLIRSCARARLGRLAEALADQERAAELLRALAEEPSPFVRAELERSRVVVATLREAIAAGRSAPVAAACEGFWDRWVRPRPRSPLLDG